jgi:hypothetical protein
MQPTAGRHAALTQLPPHIANPAAQSLRCVIRLRLKTGNDSGLRRYWLNPTLHALGRSPSHALLQLNMLSKCPLYLTSHLDNRRGCG